MHVLYIITKADEIGGAQIHIRDLCLQLQKDGCKATVIVGESGSLVDQLNANGVSVKIVDALKRNISPLDDIKSIFLIRSAIKHINPDIISLHSSKAGIVGRVAACGLNIPVIFTAHGWAFANGVGKIKQKIFCTIERIMAPLASKIITVSEQDKNLAIQKNVASDTKQIVIHNGMPDTDYTHRYSSANTKKVKMVSVARFSEQKDHKSLFLALSSMTSLDWELKLVGKGPLIDFYKQYTVELGLDTKIEFLGERNDVEVILADSDIFLLISNWEGFPRSILEAMRAGLPVIASDVGGTSESVIDGKTGYLIPRGDVIEIKEKLTELICNSQLREIMGKAGRNSYVESFTFDSMYDKTYSLYNALTKKNNKSVKQC